MNTKQFIILFLFFSVLLSVKLLHRSADAPERVTWSRTLFSDESDYAHNARNKVLYGVWNTDTLFYTVVSPIVNITDYAMMRIFNVTYKSIRITAYACSFLTLCFLFLAVWNMTKKFSFSLLTTALVGFNFSYFFYSRHILLEIPVILFLMLSVYFLQKMTPWNLFIAGVFSVLAYMTKPTYGIWIVICLLTLLSEDKDLSERYSLIKKYGGGVATLLALYFLLFLLPFHETIAKLIKQYLAVFYSQPSSLGEKLNRLRQVFDSEFFRLMPVIYLFSFLSLMDLLKSSIKRQLTKHSFLERLSLFWFLTGIAFLAPWNYRPSRYYLHLVIPMSILAATYIRKIYNNELSNLLSKASKWYLILQTGVIYYIVNECIRFYAPSGFYYQSLLNKIIVDGSVVFIVLSLIFIARAYSQNKISGKAIAISFIVLSFCFDIVPGIKWALNPRYTLMAVSKDIGETLPQGSIVAGAWAPALCFENKLKPISVMPEFSDNEKEYFNMFHIEYILLEDSKDELEMMRKKYPDVMNSAQKIKEYHIHNETVILFKIMPATPVKI